jgi:hypothetical protein
LRIQIAGLVGKSGTVTRRPLRRDALDSSVYRLRRLLRPIGNATRRGLRGFEFTLAFSLAAIDRFFRVTLGSKHFAHGVSDTNSVGQSLEPRCTIRLWHRRLLASLVT